MGNTFNQQRRPRGGRGPPWANVGGTASKQGRISGIKARAGTASHPCPTHGPTMQSKALCVLLLVCALVLGSRAQAAGGKVVVGGFGVPEDGWGTL